MRSKRDRTNLLLTRADLTDARHASAIRRLINAYAHDVRGDPVDLSPGVLDRLVPGLIEHPTSLVILAEIGEEVVGVAVCFVGFSTFTARPLLNVHDLVVDKRYRGRGIGTQLLQWAETEAKTLGCCKITLEVRETNRKAQALYRRLGYSGLNDEMPNERKWFCEKPLPIDQHE